MVIGSGLIGDAFKEYNLQNDIIIFASGVSNSKEIRKEEFLREERLLKMCLKKYATSKKIIYFSTCSIYDLYFKRNEYTKHKINMEKIITSESYNYIIFRIPQVLGLNNKNQLIGYLYNCIKTETFFELYNIERNIIDVEDIVLIVNKFIKSQKYNNTIQNIANTSNIKVFNIVSIIEGLCKKRANYKLVNINGNLKIELSNMKLILEKNKIFNDNYLEERIKKYYE